MPHPGIPNFQLDDDQYTRLISVGGSIFTLKAFVRPTGEIYEITIMGDNIPDGAEMLDKINRPDRQKVIDQQGILRKLNWRLGALMDTNPDHTIPFAHIGRGIKEDKIELLQSLANYFVAHEDTPLDDWPKFDAPNWAQTVKKPQPPREL